MKLNILLIAATLIALSASSQANGAPQDIKRHLASPVQVDSLRLLNEKVRVSEAGDAAAIVEKSLRQDAKAIGGYRIIIYMSNSQTARQDAMTAQETFLSLFPKEASYLSYENPYFKVAVGNCTSQEEAIILLGKLRSTFPKAFIMRENIAISEFAR